MSFAAADQSLYWAELTTSNSEVWFDGLSDEQLTPEDAESFNTLAEAWVIRMFTGFDGSSRLGVLGFEEIWVQQAALKLHQNTGLLRWWRSFEERMPDQAGGFVALVNQEMEGLSGEDR